MYFSALLSPLAARIPAACPDRRCLLLLGIFALLLTTARPASALGTAVPYTGQLLSGTAALNGQYDFQFTLYNAATGGTTVGSTLSKANLTVANGVFYVELDFGSVYTGTALYLQTAYRVHPTSGNPDYTLQTVRKLFSTSGAADYAALSGSTTSLQGFFVSARAPTDGQVLTWTASGNKWLPQSPLVPPAYTAGTGLTLSGTQFSVAAGGITNSLLATNAVSTAKLADGSVSNAKIATNAVSNSKLADGSVSNAKLATNAVSNSKLANGSVSGSKLSLPLTASVSSDSDLFTLSNSGNGRAIVGNSSNSNGVEGIYGAASGLSGYYAGAVLGDTNTGNGVVGRSSASGGYGVLGITDTNGFVGVYGNTANTSGYGVEGIGGAYGVYGSGTSYGLYGSGGTYGVYGYGTSYGLYGDSSGGYGVYGNTTNGNYGVYGNSGHGYGVYANGPVAGVYANSTNIGVYGKGPYGVVGEGTTDAGYFYGNVYVSGTLAKAGGSFKIDDPIDPAHKYLSHSFVESPDMKNIYDGTITTNANGDATITMPDWFEALNQDFRYQLTCIGQFAQAIVATEMDGNQFTIKTDKPNVKVSWQVTGTRHDAWANAHRIPVEEDKPAGEQGLYLHPKEFGMPESLAIVPTHPGTNAHPVQPTLPPANVPTPPTRGTQQ